MRLLITCSAALLLSIMTLGAAPPAARQQEQGSDVKSMTTTLRQAAGETLLIGAAIPPHVVDDPKLSKILAEQFNCLTAENVLKPDALQRERGKFTFAEADRIAAFAQQHDMKLVGHTLLWHQQLPGWMFADENRKPLPREQALANLKSHIETVVKHFDGKVVGWDVVNEAISDKDDEFLRDTPARRAIGDDYIVKAFEFARAASPNVQLYYNDYSIEVPAKRAKAIRLIKQLQAAGVHVDAVGIQGHWQLEFPKTSMVEDAINAFAALGVKVMITELDIDVLPRKTGGADISATETGGLDPYKQKLPPEMQQKLAARYRELFHVFAKHRGKTLTRVTFWGFYDGSTWLDNWPVRGRTNHPLLWDRELQPKPALSAVIEELQR